MALAVHATYVHPQCEPRALNPRWTLTLRQLPAQPHCQPPGVITKHTGPRGGGLACDARPHGGTQPGAGVPGWERGGVAAGYTPKVVTPKQQQATPWCGQRNRGTMKKGVHNFRQVRFTCQQILTGSTCSAIKAQASLVRHRFTASPKDKGENSHSQSVCHHPRTGTLQG